MNCQTNGLAPVGGRVPPTHARTGTAVAGRWAPFVLAIVLACAAISGCVSGPATDGAQPAPSSIESSPFGEHGNTRVDEPATEVQTHGDDAGASAPSASANRAAQAPTNGAPRVESVVSQRGPRRGTAAAFAVHDVLTVEELLEQGLYAAGVSPVHLAVRGTAGADTVRCGRRGIARTAAQREGAIRYWLQLAADEAIPSVAYLEAVFAATLNTLNPEYRETAKSNFRAIARGGLSEDYLFLTCFADYAVSNYLLGTGTTPGR